MQMYVAGEWCGADREEDVTNPFDGSVIDTVPVAGVAEADRALAAAVDGARAMRALSAYERTEIVRRAAELVAASVEELAQTIALEVGKPLAEARGEASRIPDLLRVSASEGARMHGETVPVDASANGAGKLGLTIRQPCGIVVAITPFNFPALLTGHKVGPALAAGNAVILKPARHTPLTGLWLTRKLLEAGLPENAIQCLTGPGSELGRVLCSDPRVRKISFTGSTAVGEDISRVAGVKRLSLELGANCPLIVLPDADLDKVAAATATGGYVNAGQVCISVQRVLIADEVYDSFVERLTPLVENIKTGHPLAEGTTMGPVISEAEAERVESAIRGAVEGGARLLAGGEREGAVVAPSILGDVDPGHGHLPRRAVRAGGGAHPGHGHRPGDRPRQRQRLRPRRRAVHVEPRERAALRARGGLRLDPDQLVPALARRSDAVRRAQGQRNRQGRPTRRDRGDDRAQDRRLPSVMSRAIPLDVVGDAGIPCARCRLANSRAICERTRLSSW